MLQHLAIQLAYLLSKDMRDVNIVNHAGRAALGVSVENEFNDWISKPLIHSGSRLLLKRPHLELDVNLHQPSRDSLFHLDFYVRRGSNTSIKELGNYPEGPDVDEFAIWGPVEKLQRLLRNQESLDLNDGSWVSYDNSTPLSHRE